MLLAAPVEDYLNYNRTIWSDVKRELAAAAGITEEDPAFRKISRRVTETRFAITEVAAKVIGAKCNYILAHHALKLSTPGPDEAKRIEYNCAPLAEFAKLVLGHLSSGRAPEAIEPIVLPWFESARPTIPRASPEGMQLIT